MLSTKNQSFAPPSKSGTKSSGDDSANPTSKVIGVVEQLATTMQSAISEIREINENAKLLSLNARIEAARAGSSGAAFGVVAQEMQDLSSKTASVADEMANKTRDSIDTLIQIIGGNVKGTRLADVALTNIDLVDRNLYERTCDVRWWATDSALVDALSSQSHESIDFARRRMGIILNAYTVYLDLVLCDTHGMVIANGRPNSFHSVGRNESKSLWFTRAMATQNGDQFASQSPHRSMLVDDQNTAIYSAAVRRDGEARGQAIGVLGVLFNWDALANAILNNASFDAIESLKMKRLLLDEAGNILAASSTTPREFRFPLQRFEKLYQSKKGYVLDQIDGTSVCVAHAISPGFETYATGWHSVIIEDLN
jgi:hypothetical protein